VAVSQPYIGQIRMFSFSFPPRGWALCNGQLLPIAQNQALFSILGTSFGGNGVQTFALPNMQSRAPVHVGGGGGVTLGDTGGAEGVALSAAQIPPHVHGLASTSTAGDRIVSNGSTLANVVNNYNHYGPASAGTLVALAPGALAPEGAGQPHPNIQPYLAVNFSISLQGLFPSRN
jgi:microcystin-dependent protein